MKPNKIKILICIACLAFVVTVIAVAYLFWPRQAVEKDLLPAITPYSYQSSSDVKSAGLLPSYQLTVPWDKDMFDGFYANVKTVPDIGPVRGGIVPYDSAAGYMPATFFNYLKKQQPSVVVVFAGNRFSSSSFTAISTLRDWKSPYGITKTDTDIIGGLLDKGMVAVDEGIVRGENSLTSVITYVKASLPDTRVVPVIFSPTAPTSSMDNMLAALWQQLPSDVVFVSSFDFSRYQTLPAANFHDELSAGAITNFDFSRLQKLDTDSIPALYAVMKSMEHFGTQKTTFSLHDNLAGISQNPGLTETTGYYSPYFTAGNPEKEKISSMLFFGDMMLDRNVKKAIDKYGKDYLFSALAGPEQSFFTGMDAIHANMEGPFADSRRQTTKSIAFRFDPLLLPMLQKYNFSIFTAANNHSMDMSAAGFKESNANLAKAGFDVYGSQYSVDDGSMLIKKVGDYNIAFIGINDTNSPVDTAKVIELIKKGKQSADFVILNIHWGTEYKETSNQRQQGLAHALIDAGADVIIGHHPHVVEEMEIYKNRPIFYSLGNFIFDQYFSTPTQQGLAIGLVLKDKIASIYVFPLEGNNSQVRQMDYAKSVGYLNQWIAKSRLSDYVGKFVDYNLKINL